MMPRTTYTWDEIRPGETATVDIGKEDVSLTKIDFQVNERVSDVNVVVTRLDSKPAEIQYVAGRVYQYMNINHTENLNQTNVKSVTIGFRVNKTWVAGNNINKSSVKLNRYADNSWVGLGTWLVNETLNYVNYESISPGFSYFVITGEVVNVTVPVCNNNSICEPELGESITNCPSDCNVTGQICIPGDKRCSGSLLQECNVNGTGWVIVQNCTYACANGQCIEKLRGDYIFWLVVFLLICVGAGIFVGRFYKLI